MVSEANSEKKLPLFYGKPVPLQAKLHGGHVLAREADYRFAAATNVVPLNAVEFIPAARSYPIVFAGSGDSMPVAILGLKAGRNLFVGDDGAWRAGEYIPAYVRRYPFLFFEHRDAGQFTLGFDESSSLIRDQGDGQPLFSGDQPSEVSRRALEFCGAYQREAAATRQFCAALGGAGLLAARALNVRRGDGSTQVVSDFQVIDDTGLKALAGETVLDWHTKGYMAAVHAQLVSLGCWSRLAGLEG